MEGRTDFWISWTDLLYQSRYNVFYFLLLPDSMSFACVIVSYRSKSNTPDSFRSFN